MADWAKTCSKRFWRDFNLANSNELTRVRRAIVESENERWRTFFTSASVAKFEGRSYVYM